MDEQLLDRTELLAESRARRNPLEFTNCPTAQLDFHQSQGWEVYRKNKTSYRLSRPKDHWTWLEDRVWTLMYSMGFQRLSSRTGVKITVDKTQNQLDVVALDDEVAIAIECKSMEVQGRRTNFQGELGKFSLVRPKFTESVRTSFPNEGPRITAQIMFLHNANLSVGDRERASQANMVVFDTKDLEYYEDLTKLLGTAARYQFLADVLAGKKIPGLAITIPAIKSRMGGQTCYTFSIEPETLLKIAYVSHRAKGKASDVDAYQRMISKSRLSSIRKYIDQDAGVFPTNIVLSLDQIQTFERTKQEYDSGDTLGWLKLSPKYKSAWIIDGQHRLFSYAGAEKASSSRLSVLAFENLSTDLQAQLFIDINGEQKAVKKALLQELYSELHWNSDDPKSRQKAVVAKAISVLDEDPTSPFFGRIKSAEGSATPGKSIYFGNLFSALSQPEFFFSKTRNGKAQDFGAFWSEDNDSMLRRTVMAINGWFTPISERNQTWWDLGSAPGGGVSMNDSVTSLVMTLRSVLEELKKSGSNPYALSDKELVEIIRPYAAMVGEHLQGYKEEDRANYRAFRGVQGRTTRMRRIQQAIATAMPTFHPDGLDKYLTEQEQETNSRSQFLVAEIEKKLQSTIIELLKSEYGENDQDWWFNGIPEKCRLPAAAAAEKHGYQRGGKENYLNLIDYQEIIKVSKNWKFLSPIFALGSPNSNKDDRIKWLVTVNEIRNIVMHASSGQTVSLDQLEMLESIHNELLDRINHFTNSIG